MKINLVPGPRNEKRIAAIMDVRRNSTPEEWEEYVLQCAEDEQFLDALYYVSECGEFALEDQARYFHDLLLNDENGYFAARLGGFDYN